MTKREAYKLGQRLGANAAHYCDQPGPQERAEASGCTCEDTPWPDGGRECEAYASEINGARDPEGQWEAYDAGVAAGIKAGVKARLAQQPVRQ